MYLFIMMYFSSFLLALSCNNWFLLWMSLEINMMSFIVLIFNRMMNNVESCMKYFFIQSLGSSLLLVMFYLNYNISSYMGCLILSYKMGVGPFFFWFPSVCDGISWKSCFMLMSFQKVLPMLILSTMLSMMLWMVVMLSLITGVLGAMNQNNLKILMAFSSIHHTGWMMMIMLFNQEMWIIYLIMYMMLISSIIFMFSKYEILKVEMLKGKSFSWMFIFCMFSMGGIPPFLGFYMKWWIFYNLMFLDKIMFCFMVLMSVLMFYVYIRICFYLFLGMNMMSWNKSIMLEISIFNFDVMYMLGVNFFSVLFFLLM